VGYQPLQRTVPAAKQIGFTFDYLINKFLTLYLKKTQKGTKHMFEGKLIKACKEGNKKLVKNIFVSKVLM